MTSPPLNRSENPFHVAFWLGDVDPRPLALFRITFGLALLHDLANFAPNFRAFITDRGILPPGAQAERLAWTLFERLGSEPVAWTLFGLGVLATLAFTVGFHTRTASVITWLFFTELHTRNLYVIDGGDDLVRNLLFLSMFAEMGACYGVDADLRGHRQTAVPAVGLRFLQLHLAVLYFVAARLKFRAGWLTHNAIYKALQLTGFVRPPGAFLLSVPPLCYVLGVVTLALEWVYAFAALSPVRASLSRAIAIFCGVSVQLGILVTMRVGVFTEAMLAAMFLLVQPEWLDALAKRWRLLEGAFSPPPIGKTVARVGPLRLAVFIALGLNLIPLLWAPFIGGRVRPPSWVLYERAALWIYQPFGLFDVTYDVPRWDVSGALSTGKEVDVLPAAVPDLIPRIGWSFSRWYKFTFKERERPFRFEPLSDFMCREYDRNTGTHLASIVIVETLTPPAKLGEPLGETRRRERHRQSCPPPGT